MKGLNVLLFLSVFSVGCASINPTGTSLLSDSDRVVERIIEAPGFSQDEIYNGTKIWIAENFKSAKSVLEYENKEDGTLLGNGSILYPCVGLQCISTANWKVPFTMRVDTKDQKFRLTFTNINIAWPSSYNSIIGVIKAHDAPVATKEELDRIRPILLEFGDQVLAAVKSDNARSDW